MTSESQRGIAGMALSKPRISDPQSCGMPRYPSSLDTVWSFLYIPSLTPSLRHALLGPGSETSSPRDLKCQK